MRKVYGVGITALFMLGMAVSTTFAGSVTVGRFYVELAKAKNLVAGDAVAAENNLRRAGVVLPALPLQKSLTEGDMQSISTALGLRVTTEQPGSVISETQMSTYLASFGGQIKVRNVESPGSDPTLDSRNRKHKHKSKRKHKHKRKRKKRKRRRRSRHEPI